jgi:hypothetical protein
MRRGAFHVLCCSTRLPVCAMSQRPYASHVFTLMCGIPDI